MPLETERIVIGDLESPTEQIEMGDLPNLTATVQCGDASPETEQVNVGNVFVSRPVIYGLVGGSYSGSGQENRRYISTYWDLLETGWSSTSLRSKILNWRDHGAGGFWMHQPWGAGGENAVTQDYYFDAYDWAVDQALTTLIDEDAHTEFCLWCHQQGMQLYNYIGSPGYLQHLDGRTYSAPEAWMYDHYTRLAQYGARVAFDACVDPNTNEQLNYDFLLACNALVPSSSPCIAEPTHKLADTDWMANFDCVALYQFVIDNVLTGANGFATPDQLTGKVYVIMSPSSGTLTQELARSMWDTLVEAGPTTDWVALVPFLAADRWINEEGLTDLRSIFPR